jgi:hypothetical protein
MEGRQLIMVLAPKMTGVKVLQKPAAKPADKKSEAPAKRPPAKVVAEAAADTDKK